MIVIKGYKWEAGMLGAANARCIYAHEEDYLFVDQAGRVVHAGLAMQRIDFADAATIGCLMAQVCELHAPGMRASFSVRTDIAPQMGRQTAWWFVKDRVGRNVARGSFQYEDMTGDIRVLGLIDAFNNANNH